jgi:hypothetical protein
MGMAENCNGKLTIKKQWDAPLGTTSRFRIEKDARFYLQESMMLTTV